MTWLLRPSFPALFGVAALALAFSSGCGGNVIVDGPGTGGSGGTTGTITDPDDCGPNLALCNGFCTDTSSDDANCGGCGISCGDGDCFQGSCSVAPDCPLDLTLCNGSCVDTFSDNANCGGCNTVCSGGAVCSGGTCAIGECVCGSLCDIQDLGNKVPQTVFDSTDGKGDSFALECAKTSGLDALYAFTAPSDGFYFFDTFGASIDTAIQLLAPACESLGCNDDFLFSGDPGVGAKLAANQTVVIVVDSLGNFGDWQLHISDEAGCFSCGELISSEIPEHPCVESIPLYESLIGCLCQGACAMACADLCNGTGQVSDQCQGCVTSPNGCGNALDDCANDF